jgi:signal transduction histidine kinase
VPRLIVTRGPDEGRQFPLAGPSVVVGRHSANPVPLTDTRVSRRHLELAAVPGGYRITDLGSGNGTRVNGQLVQSADLRPGDQIALGDTVLLYAADGPAAGAAPAGPGVQLFVTPESAFRSSIVRTIGEDAGSKILANPSQAVTDWLRGRLASLTVLYEAAAASSNILDVDELLDRIMGLLVPAADADRGCVMLRDAETGELMPKGVRSGRPGGGAVAVSRTVVEHVLRERQGVLVADAAADERFRGGASILAHNIGEVICVPMRGRHETVGVVFLSRNGVGASGPCQEKPGGRLTPTTGTDTVRRFTDDHLQLAVAVAHQAALAVEETRYYQALLNAERLAAVGQTIAALSHHIKNIMQGVRFGSDMVRTALAADDRDLLVKGWKLVERNQGRIDELILDMLSYSKEREPAAEPTDLAKLAEDVLDVVRGRAAEKGVALTFEPAAGLPLVPCDPDGVHRALLNVVSNALDAVDGRDAPRVAVAVGLAADGGWAELTVADNGPGVPADKAEEIFRPFVSTKGSRGTGLGLPVSRKVMREHGGDLLVEPAAGGGSRFVLRLPMPAGTIAIPATQTRRG